MFNYFIVLLSVCSFLLAVLANDRLRTVFPSSILRALITNDVEREQENTTGTTARRRARRNMIADFAPLSDQEWVGSLMLTSRQPRRALSARATWFQITL